MMNGLGGNSWGIGTGWQLILGIAILVVIVGIYMKIKKK